MLVRSASTDENLEAVKKGQMGCASHKLKRFIKNYRLQKGGKWKGHSKHMYNFKSIWGVDI